MSKNRDAGLKAFRYWYDFSRIAMFGTTSFSQEVKALDFRSTSQTVFAVAPEVLAKQTQTTFFEKFGASVLQYPDERVKSAMSNLANAYQQKLPPGEEFFNYLAAAGGAITIADLGDVLVESTKQVSDIAVSVGKNSIYLYVGIAALGLFILPQLMRGRSAA